MSTPIIFIFFPLSISILLYMLQKKTRLVSLIGILTCILIALFAIFQDFGGVLKIGSMSVEIKTTFSFLGRSFALSNEDRFFLSFVFISSALWFGVTGIAGVSVSFIPLGLAIISIMTGALAVEPFLYSAILVEIAVIVAIPLMIQKGKPVGKGVLRFLIFQSLAMPLVLFGGWLLGGIQASPSDASRLLQAALFLGIGFAFWLAVFPFQSWVPQLTTEIHPLIAGFFLGLFPVVTLLIMLDFISGLVWLRESLFIGPVLRLVGTIMIVSTGIWAAFEQDARRLFGYAVLLESGFSLVLVSMQSNINVKTLFISFVPRMIGLAVLALALSVIIQNGISPTIGSLKGMIRKLPFASSALLVSLLSITGFPLLAGFPFRLATLEKLGQGNLNAAMWVLVGITAFLFAVIRLLSGIASPTLEKWQAVESVSQMIYLSLGILALVILGVLPNIFGDSIAGLFIYLPILR
ncbi:MAG: hypothetical protein C0401_00110 [Anaerolinea sp.]|nr:hypothetical protein [Anaerolinea sp.]